MLLSHCTGTAAAAAATRSCRLGRLPTPQVAGGALAAAAPAAHLGAERDLHRICQLLHARQQAGAALIAESQLLGGIAAGLEGLEGLQGRWRHAANGSGRGAAAQSKVEAVGMLGSVRSSAMGIGFDRRWGAGDDGQTTHLLGCVPPPSGTQKPCCCLHRAAIGKMRAGDVALVFCASSTFF